MQKQFDKAASLIQNAGKIIALTGAGVSTESGIPDFRSKGNQQQYAGCTLASVGAGCTGLRQSRWLG